MKSLNPENNFADLAEAAKRLLNSDSNDNEKSLAGIIIVLAKRCDKLEREVEVLTRKIGAA